MEVASTVPKVKEFATDTLYVGGCPRIFCDRLCAFGLSGKEREKEPNEALSVTILAQVPVFLVGYRACGERAKMITATIFGQGSSGGPAL